MGVESPTDTNRNGEDLATLQNTLGSQDIAFVDTLNAEINTLISNTDALQYDYVIGDVSDYGVHRGNTHFDLVHEQASIHCVIFNSQQKSRTLDIENGMQVAVKGNLSYYENGGKGSLITETVIDVGEGIYQQIYEKNKQLLEEDNLLDEAAKLPLPQYPQCIGIATSAQSSAREDAVTSLHDRHPGVDIVVQDTSVQGTNAMQSMMRAIDALDADGQVDVIVLTRGGGSAKHLRVFNETPLCRVIHNTLTPIVVGVGHEDDRTLADEVADRRVMTPTEVGEIVPRKDELNEQLTTTADRLNEVYTQTVATGLADRQRALDNAFKRLEQQKIHESKQAEAAKTQRRQRIALAVLVVLILILLAYVLL